MGGGRGRSVGRLWINCKIATAYYPRRPEVGAEMNRGGAAALFESKNPFRIWLPPPPPRPSASVRPLIFLIARCCDGIRKIGGFDSCPRRIAKIGQIFGWLGKL